MDHCYNHYYDNEQKKIHFLYYLTFFFWVTFLTNRKLINHKFQKLSPCNLWAYRILSDMYSKCIWVRGGQSDYLGLAQILCFLSFRLQQHLSFSIELIAYESSLNIPHLLLLLLGQCVSLSYVRLKMTECARTSRWRVFVSIQEVQSLQILH